MAAKTKEKDTLQDWLILNSYVIDQFGFSEFADFREILAEIEDNEEDLDHSQYCQLILELPGLKISSSDIEEYDARIRGHLQKMNQRREKPIRLKYFQYLAALFTEYYLHRYFTDKGGLSRDLETWMLSFVDEKKRKDPFPLYERFLPSIDDLHRIVFWMATGSGKTYLLHLHYYQFQHYNQKQSKIDFDNILLITPSEDLSRQHAREMEISGIPCVIFDGTQTGGYWSSGPDDTVRIIDIHKLTEEKSGKGVQVDIEHFGNKNIIFVDEAHKGTGGKKWKYFRNEIAKEGFTFEYSATFGQAVAATGTRGQGDDDPLALYGKSVLFDYSYRHFYDDGYGKEFRLLNLKDSAYTPPLKDNLLLANLLTFFQQKIIFEKNPDEMNEYNIKNPLWVFVGKSINVPKKDSDVFKIIEFLYRYLTDSEWAIRTLSNFLSGRSDFINKFGHDIFDPSYPEHRLEIIHDLGYDAPTLYADIKRLVFNSGQSSALTMVKIKGADGEIGLRCGDNPFFGLVYVGEDTKFLKLVETSGIQISHPPPIDHSSIFESIESEKSPVNILIGAKKFNVGWNAYRVSSMGLMKIGKSEGSEIIQLFGRGVRLWGKGNSLKRSTNKFGDQPKILPFVESLNVFGIGAGYMEQFEVYLREEGATPEPTESFTIKIQLQKDYFSEGLIYPKIYKTGFERYERISLTMDDIIGFSIHLTPTIQVKDSRELDRYEADNRPTPISIKKEFLEILDWDRIYFDLLEYRRAQNWSNVVFTKDLFRKIIESQVYSLYCPETLINPIKFENLDNVHLVVVAILKKALYVSVGRKKNRWLINTVKPEILTESHENFAFGSYSIVVREKDTEIVESVKRIAEEELEKFCAQAGGKFITNVFIRNHLFQPLLSKTSKLSQKIEIHPEGLNDGEEKFVNILKNYIEENESKLADYKIFLLRNLPKSGIGFFQNVWFYPDFIIWLKHTKDESQKIIFADPKGVVHLNGFEDEKIQLAKNIKKVEVKINEVRGKQDIQMESFIVSTTSRVDADQKFGRPNARKYLDNHILFLDDSRWVETMMGI